MKTCQVQSREDRTGGKQVPCSEPAVFKAKYAQFLHYPAHTSYMCFKHGEMASELVKVDRKVD